MASAALLKGTQPGASLRGGMFGGSSSQKSLLIRAAAFIVVFAVVFAMASLNVASTWLSYERTTRLVATDRIVERMNQAQKLSGTENTAEIATDDDKYGESDHQLDGANDLATTPEELAAVTTPPPPLGQTSPSILMSGDAQTWRKAGDSFGARGAYRTAHVEARATTTEEFNDFDDPDLLPFKKELVSPSVAHLRTLQIESEYFRFEDDFHLIDSLWTDEQVLQALQRLIDIWAQANIRIRVRRREVLARVKLSRVRSLAYLFYVDYPHGADPAKYPIRTKRREALNTLFDSPAYIKLLGDLDRERQGLFDWILGWPEERTPWENENVVGVYPTYYYMYMNGGGEKGCMRFRIGDCGKVQKSFLLPNGAKHEVKCEGFDRRNRHADNALVIRPHERTNFTMATAIRLVAHEWGHSVGLHHPRIPDNSPSYCQQYDSWDKGELMHQVRAISVKSLRCRPFGYPELATAATRLGEYAIAQARKNVLFDLRETPRLKGNTRVGHSIEQLVWSEERLGMRVMDRAWPGVDVADVKNKVRFCFNYLESFTDSIGFIVTRLPSPTNGRITRVRWKSSNDFGPLSAFEGLTLAVVERVDQPPVEGAANSMFRMKSTYRIVDNQRVDIRPHEYGAHVHQDHFVPAGLNIRQGQFVVVLARLAMGRPRPAQVNGTASSTLRHLVPVMRLYENPETLTGDESKLGNMEGPRRHPKIVESMISVDPNFEPAKRHFGGYGAAEEKRVSAFGIVTKATAEGDLTVMEPPRGRTCPDLVFNYDVDPQ